ncbi:MAG: TMEM165/GDT1 family protein [Steroidobacteraceae bacterium]
MDPKLVLTVFGTVFLAELGDKTQLATLLFASRPGSNLVTIFVAASLALLTTTAMGVVAGAVVANYLQPKYLNYLAGVGFILVGVWTLWRA